MPTATFFVFVNFLYGIECPLGYKNSPPFVRSVPPNTGITAWLLYCGAHSLACLVLEILNHSPDCNGPPGPSVVINIRSSEAFFFLAWDDGDMFLAWRGTTVCTEGVTAATSRAPFFFSPRFPQKCRLPPSFLGEEIP